MDARRRFASGRATAAGTGVAASVAWGALDAYLEAEYVDDRRHPGSRYAYSWSEFGWTPMDRLRVGLVSQRTRSVDSGRDFQMGAFAQVTVQRLTFSVYAFNPDAAARYVIASVTATF